MPHEALAIALGHALPDRRRHVAHEGDGFAPVAAHLFRFRGEQSDRAGQSAQRSGRCQQQRIAIAFESIGSKRCLARWHQTVT